MKFGCCTNIKNYKEIADAGYEAISLAGKDIAAMSDAEYEEALAAIKKGPLSFSSMNAAFPPEVKLNGPDFDPDKVAEYTEKLCKRAKAMGAKYIGIGSPKSRTVPDGFDFDKAKEQFEEAVKIICDIAAKYGMSACIEACCDLETNFINTTDQAIALVRKLGLPNLHIVYDIYHAYMMKEKPELIKEAFDHITGVHISKPVNGRRFYPDIECMREFKPYIDILRSCGYDGEFSTEAFDGDFSEGIRTAIEQLKKSNTGVDMGDKKRIVGITMGDPAGNGPELSVKVMMKPETYAICNPLIVGDIVAMEEAQKVVEGAEGFKLNKIDSVDEAKFELGTIDVLHVPGFELAKRRFKKDRKALLEKFSAEEVEAQYLESRKMTGDCAFKYIIKVIEMAMAGEVDATVTNALNKDYINIAGHHYSGHTEIYADYTKASHYAMLLAYGDLRVVHNSTHVSLKEACDRVKKDRVLEVIRLANQGCKALGVAEPKVGVCGLNPHCGEDGMFGREEIDEIQPAINEALKEGINIPDKAPIPADTAFSKALGGWYDIVVVMYHDQGHIPLKVEGFRYNKVKGQWDAVEGINMTLGLPIIRVSVDHGTGEGHAGSGGANELSLMNAIDCAVKMAESRAKGIIA